MTPHTYGGTEIEIGGIVWIFDVWASTPVYHRADFVGPIGRMHLQTFCGFACDAEHRNGQRSAIALPPKHATRIGRPCLTCWPELRRQTSLFATRRPKLVATDQQEALV